MELETHYDALIQAEHQKLKELRTRPWALSLKLFGKGEAEAKAWIYNVGFAVLVTGYLVALKEAWMPPTPPRPGEGCTLEGEGLICMPLPRVSSKSSRCT